MIIQKEDIIIEQKEDKIDDLKRILDMRHEEYLRECKINRKETSKILDKMSEQCEEIKRQCEEMMKQSEKLINIENTTCLYGKYIEHMYNNSKKDMTEEKNVVEDMNNRKFQIFKDNIDTKLDTITYENKSGWINMNKK
ncbi:hypothetical protein [Heterosigma akashiwo virus 01]|jgi:hypothetical protein|uniref:Uncharacterized protein n=1 Tax=Heterosigma akashiwo virus 01 TaxID=97195 RepID=A0A1C9C5C4_HAV01|nr:hypothetical protein D1R72_gp154 [Heterosigma akashiwo virus 01]AOM63485.1 hypothetical protein [Heterosigma akashiwo virus 01]